jgi:Domain of unknown function (DUF4126)
VDALIGAFVGLALSAAVGFRVFVPLLLAGAAARLGYLELTSDMAWLGSDAALVALATATVLEVSAYYVPWLDNLLDAIATPTAIVAGAVAWVAVTPDLSPLLRWTLAVVAGGGVAGAIQAGTALLRLQSSGFTGGLANPVLATAELLGALALSVMGVLAPVLAAVLVVLVLLGLGFLYRRATNRRNAAPYSKP